MKALIKTLLRRLGGWELHRIQPAEPEPRGPLQFGPYTIETDNVALLRSYRDYPETNTVISRLSRQLAADGPGAFIDIGANCGDSTALAKCYAPDWPVLCIEGDPKLGALLRRNLGHLLDVELAQVYLGAKAETIQVNLGKEGWNNTLQNTGAGTVPLELTTLDATLQSWPHRKSVRLVKIDTEGYDVPILIGSQSLLQDIRPVILFEYNREAMHDVAQDGWPGFALLRRLGYDQVCFYDAFGRFILATSLHNEDLLRDLHDYADGKFGKVYYYDIVCFHAGQSVTAERFISAERKHRVSG